MSDEEFDGVQKRLIIWILLAVVGGNTGVMFLNKTSPEFRSDPFTGSDAEELRKDMVQYIDHRFQVHKLSIPPQGTRARVFQIEEWIKEKDPTYKRPTSNW